MHRAGVTDFFRGSSARRGRGRPRRAHRTSSPCGRLNLRLHSGSPRSGKKFFRLRGKSLRATRRTKMEFLARMLHGSRSLLRVDQHPANRILFARRRSYDLETWNGRSCRITGFNHWKILDDSACAIDTSKFQTVRLRSIHSTRSFGDPRNIVPEIFRPSQTNPTTAITFKMAFATRSARGHKPLPKNPAIMHTSAAEKTRDQR